jgi:hypothetical protein
MDKKAIRDRIDLIAPRAPAPRVRSRKGKDVYRCRAARLRGAARPEC